MVLSDAIPNRNGVGTYYNDLMDHLGDHVGEAAMIPSQANCIFRKKRWSVPVPGDKTQRLYFPNLPRILKQVRLEQPNIFITPSLGPFAILACFLAKRKKRPLILGYHTCFDQLAHLYWKGARARCNGFITERFNRVLIKRADLVVVNSDEMRAETERLGARRIRLVGTTLGRAFTDTPVTPCDGPVRRVMFAGRLAREKNVESVLAAARAMPELSFDIVGDGPERASLEREAADLANLTFHGWLGRTEVLSRIDASDLLVLPSHLESFGSIAFEAMARCRPVLVSEFCGILRQPELAPQLYSFTREEGLTRAIARIRDSDPEERASKALGGRRQACALSDQTVHQWIEILDELQAPPPDAATPD